jgi:site-specific DNA-methyltransferase (adenine-specific)
MEQALHFKRLGLNLHDTMIYMKPNFSAVGALQTRYAPVFEYMMIFSHGKPKTFNPIKDRKAKSAGESKSGTIRCANGDMKPMSNQGWVQPEYGQRFNVWEINTESQGSDHPAPFPFALARDHILSWSNPGDLVLDPFSGSGTTCKAAKEFGRRFLGFEINEQYCAIAEQRIAQQVLEL